MTDDRRRELGSTDAPVEDELLESFEATIEEGAERLQRTVRAVLITGFFGGLEVGLGVMAYLAVLTETGSHLLAGLAFGIGFIALHLAHSELFTENFLMPVAAVVAREGSLLQLLKLWGGTLVANLVGGWVFMWLVVQAFPQWHPTLSEAAHHYIDAPFDLQSVVLAVLGGSTITLMTRMQQGTDSDPAKLVAAVAGGFLLAGLQLFHSILDSLLVFGAIQSGVDITYGQWLGWFGYTLLFNLLGGLVLVTALRLLRTKELMQGRRQTSHDHPDRASHQQAD
ncbi:MULTISPECIES: formate/nitrite transporter family protein [unclassified Curtobacterium]|uniref:formate/nitrite transporter family protein n=1 Tax=unclassified Curtobacterium TaxID=257496 RepID=UPI000DA9E2E6|nr:MULTISPECIES: formate/nitrite transporter family protein [unclassified Curtobacterium]PZE23542.1 formate/nitrite transporter family protein [Curtobacterium sp. MCBD17_028]PZE73486.1 formate/nitrite transporter family protein [Curtobacterium sp. MCBD17_019]PZF56386.1 formate/nitrite transporter family protein [Curtobacterium sp. MCBD17_034]PZF60721.1 formate/nitrite transporter family protein [Curtobacterium sp. MCBD17_013]PZM32792.1 formate/nitrite transporter family protein [Curtobacterium